MSMLKVVEILAESNQSWEDAAKQAVANAAKTVRNIKSIYIDHFEATVDGDKITRYRINAKISFRFDRSASGAAGSRKMGGFIEESLQMKTRDIHRTQPRHDLMKQHHKEEEVHDPYKPRKKPDEPCLCPQCGAVNLAGRWQWAKETHGHLQTELCPACHNNEQRHQPSRLVLNGWLAGMFPHSHPGRSRHPRSKCLKV